MKPILISLLLLLNLLSPALAEPASEAAVSASSHTSHNSLLPNPGSSNPNKNIRFKKKSTARPSFDTHTPIKFQDEKNPWLAAGFSLLLPGSGQMYVEERLWPEVLITAGMALAVVTFVIIDQQRSASIKVRTVEGQGDKRIADAHWDALTLLLQIAVPSLWLWNAGDAFHRAEMFKEKVTGELDSHTNAYIIEENLVSVTLWQF